MPRRSWMNCEHSNPTHPLMPNRLSSLFSGELVMAYACDLPALPQDIAALTSDEWTARLAAAYSARNRDEFLTLGQRLVRDVVLSIRGNRLTPYRSELYSEGLIALIQQFDRTTRPIEYPSAYFRVAVRRAVYDWARQQKIIRRK